MKSEVRSNDGRTAPEDLLARTKRFALRVVRLSAALPRTREADVLGRQLLRSGTSVGANYRAARRGRSAAEFRAKLGICVEEADESVFWLELLMEGGVVPADRLRSLHGEAEELTAILAASLLSARRNNKPAPGPKPR